MYVDVCMLQMRIQDLYGGGGGGSRDFADIAQNGGFPRSAPDVCVGEGVF